MWKIKRIGSRAFLINLEYRRVDGVQKVLVTDLQGLWSTELSDKEMLNIFRKLNPLVEAEEEKLKCEIRRMFDAERVDVHWNLETVDDELKLNAKTVTSWMPLNFCICLKAADTANYFQTVVLPLLTALKNNQKQMDYLCDIIKKKDLEIEEYKMNGAVLTRKAVMTAKFDQSMLHSVFNENLGTIAASISEDYLDSRIEYYFNEINKTDEEDKAKPILSEIKTEPRIEEIDVKQEPKDEDLGSDLPVYKKTKIVKKLKNL